MKKTINNKKLSISVEESFNQSGEFLSSFKQRKMAKALNRKLRVYYACCRILALPVFVFFLPFLIVITFILAVELYFAERRWRLPFFIEERYTQGKPFVLYKFLSTAVNGQKLFFGNLLKQIYLDELPQLYHIVNGEMTIVGPRPNPEPDYSRIKNRGYFAKVVQKAGLTGGVQTAKGSSRHGDLRLDEEYMYFCLNNNLATIVIQDLKTLWLTLKLMARAEGI